MWVNIQRLTGVAHCANVVWRDLDNPPQKTSPPRANPRSLTEPPPKIALPTPLQPPEPIKPPLPKEQELQRKEEAEAAQRRVQEEKRQRALAEAERQRATEEQQRKEKERQAEIDTTYTWLKRATDNAVIVCKNLGKIPLAQRLVEITKQDKLPIKAQEEAQQDLDRLRDRVNNVMAEYMENIKKIGVKHNDIIYKAVEKYREELFTNSELEKLKILNRAVNNHLTQYTQDKKITSEQLMADLQRL